MSAWLQLADLTLNSGRRSSFKIECDDLTDDEVAAGCALLAKVLPPFGSVAGVPTGGLRLEEAMASHLTPAPNLPLLIIDDVWTTGGSIRRFVDKYAWPEIITAVFFARGPTPPNVTVLFSLHPGLWSE